MYSWSKDAASHPVAIVVSGDRTKNTPASPAVAPATPARRSTQTNVSATSAWLITPTRCDAHGADCIHCAANPCSRNPSGRIG